MASPAVTDPPGLLMYRLMSARGSRAESRSSWAVIRLAMGSSTSDPRTMIRWWSSCMASWSSSAAGRSESVIHPACAHTSHVGIALCLRQIRLRRRPGAVGPDQPCTEGSVSWRPGLAQRSHVADDVERSIARVQGGREAAPDGIRHSTVTRTVRARRARCTVRWHALTMEADVVVVGAGLAGLVATAELADRGKRVVLLDQEGEQSLGGQAFWSFGGLFLVNSPEQRRLGIKDSLELATQDWMGSAQIDREEDLWPRRWAEAYLQFAAGEKRSWLHAQGHRLFPVVGWAERGDGRADGHGNSVPRFHVTWGTGPGLVEPFERRVRAAVASGRVTLAFRHRVDELVVTAGTVTGVRGRRLAADGVARGRPSSREEVGDFEITAQAVVVTSGGIGGNHDLVRQAWPERLGTPPARMVAGVPAHVDGRMLAITQSAGGNLINPD